MIRDSNQMKYKLLFFFLDDVDSKNKKMDANTEKLKGIILKKEKKDENNRMMGPCLGA